MVQLSKITRVLNVILLLFIYLVVIEYMIDTYNTQICHIIIIVYHLLWGVIDKNNRLHAM